MGGRISAFEEHGSDSQRENPKLSWIGKHRKGNRPDKRRSEPYPVPPPVENGNHSVSVTFDVDDMPENLTSKIARPKKPASSVTDVRQAPKPSNLKQPSKSTDLNHNKNDQSTKVSVVTPDRSTPQNRKLRFGSESSFNSQEKVSEDSPKSFSTISSSEILRTTARSSVPPAFYTTCFPVNSPSLNRSPVRGGTPPRPSGLYQPSPPRRTFNRPRPTFGAGFPSKGAPLASGESSTVASSAASTPMGDNSFLIRPGGKPVLSVSPLVIAPADPMRYSIPRGSSSSSWVPPRGHSPVTPNRFPMPGLSRVSEADTVDLNVPASPEMVRLEQIAGGTANRFAESRLKPLSYRRYEYQQNLIYSPRTTASLDQTYAEARRELQRSKDSGMVSFDTTRETLCDDLDGDLTPRAPNLEPERPYGVRYSESQKPSTETSGASGSSSSQVSPDAVEQTGKEQFAPRPAPRNHSRGRNGGLIDDEIQDQPQLISESDDLKDLPKTVDKGVDPVVLSPARAAWRIEKGHLVDDHSRGVSMCSSEDLAFGSSDFFDVRDLQEICGMQGLRHQRESSISTNQSSMTDVIGSARGDSVTPTGSLSRRPRAPRPPFRRPSDKRSQNPMTASTQEPLTSVSDELGQLVSSFHSGNSASTSLRRKDSASSSGSTARIRPPSQVVDPAALPVHLDQQTFRNVVQDVTVVKTLLLRLKRELQESETTNPFESSLNKKNGFVTPSPSDQFQTSSFAVDDLVKENSDLKSEVASLRRELDEKNKLIDSMRMLLPESQADELGVVKNTKSSSLSESTASEV